MSKYPVNMKTGRPLDQAAAVQYFRVNGDNSIPDPPRNLQSQSGSRKVLVTWDAPVITNGIAGYKIYTDNEGQLLDTVTDPNVRQYNVPASAGSTPSVMNIFVSSFTNQQESMQAQIKGSASVEAGAPADPSPPSGSGASGNGPTIGGGGIKIPGGSAGGGRTF
jgi:hypothetical protein